MNRNVFFLLAMIAVVPTGCTLAPKYDRPTAPVPDAWPQGPAYPQTQPAADVPSASQLTWKQFFVDEKLQQVIELALANNRDLRAAALNVERARAMYGIQRTELLPVVSASGGGSRQGVPAGLSATGQRMVAEQYDVNLGILAWEIDFFGRIRSLSDRALQEYLATEEARRSTQILLVAQVANAYLSLAADRESLRLAQTTLETQQGMYDLVLRRHERGIAPELDVHRAQVQVDTARVATARFTQIVAQDENALQLLVGTKVPDELLPTDLSAVTAPAEIAAALPSEVLLQRPDVLQAENLLKAANADIGAARAAFFPRISLTTAIGTASTELDGLFDAGTRAWNYAPQIVMPIFDARTWFALKASKVQREVALAQYERAIQRAFREVADILAIRGTVDDQVAAQEALVHASAETYRLSNLRYDKGLDSYLSVLDAQRSLYAAQQDLVSLRLARLASQVNLYAALGGG